MYWSKPPNAIIWLFPQYVTDAFTKHAGRCPVVRATLGGLLDEPPEADGMYDSKEASELEALESLWVGLRG